jgi:1,4-dihydroxy-2-naphthoate octaprenyltransferase
MSRLRLWFAAARPATLWAAVAPVVVGSACAAAEDGFRPLPAMAALLGAVLLQVGANYANDLYDFEKGADTAERLGPVRAVQAGLVSPRQMAVATVLVFAAAAAVGLYLFAVAGWPVLVVGTASIVAGLAYTAGPVPLAYHGLGDLFVLVFFGLVAVVGTAYVQLLAVPAPALWAWVPVGTTITAILVVNNLRDRATDERAGKRTLAVRLGARAARLELVLLLLAAHVTPIAVLATGGAGAAVLLPLVVAPLAAAIIWQAWVSSGSSLNRTLATTARHALLFGLLLAAGIVLDARGLAGGGA